jgi:hypothetical protein
MMPVIQDPGPCPCEWDGCQVIGTKLTKAGHLKGCACRSCLGRRNRRKGQAGEARAHRALGGIGSTIRDDLFHAYSLNISLETKSGNQCPARMVTAIRSEFMRKALRQATKKIPVGADAFPAVMLQPHGGGQYLVVDVSGRSLR